MYVSFDNLMKCSFFHSVVLRSNKGSFKNYVASEGLVGMVIFITNCYEDLGGVVVIILLLCSRDFFNVSFPANISGLRLKHEGLKT